tara:strand:+ start:15232 stop:15879 length:648 start_codon:yes stop_codon:yes gene_type:complete
MSFTFAQLKQAVQDYLETSETSFVNNIPLFIRMAEERILKNVRLNLFQKNASALTGAGSQFIAVPTDFLSPLSCSVTTAEGKEFLLFKELDFVQTYNPDPTVTGVPQYFATFDVDNFVLGPVPDQAYPIILHYFYRPVSLTAGAEDGVTWISENAELSLLYGTLFEAYTFLKGDQDMMQLYAARFSESMGRLKDLGEGKETTTDYREGKVRIQRS